MQIEALLEEGRGAGRGPASACEPLRGTRWQRAVAWLLLVVFQIAPPGLPAAWAGPEGEQVIHGEASFERDGSHTLITTTTHETIVNYDSFDIGAAESVHIAQPDAASRILNRVLPGDPTHVDGALSSNGIVYLLNASGVFFGETAVVDVARLVAGAGELSNADFLASIDHFSDISGDLRVDAGAQLEAASLVLVGRTVANHGTILAPDGMIALVAGSEVVLSEVDGRVRVRVEPAPVDPGGWAIQQTGTLDAGGGSISLTAGDAYSLAMNHTGITRARDVQLEGGDGGLVAVAGRVDASNREPGGTGGSIRVLGDRVAVLDAALDASGDTGGGEVLIGGDVRGGGALRSARRTYVSDDARLTADALRDGDGGRVVVWSEEKTGFFGSLSARGGAQGGDGGFAEISSRLGLESRGAIDLSAPAGRAGTLLYDPDKIEIVGGAPPDPDAIPPDGDDVNNDPSLLASDNGLPGQILFAEVGDPAGVAPFTIYESEIEGTDADIVLEAFRSVIATGTFDHEVDAEGVNVVKLMRDRRLSISTGTPENPDSGEFLGIDLIPVDGDGNPIPLAWKLSGEGAINLESLIDPSLELDAPILVGALITDGEAFSSTLLVPIAALTASATRGNVEVESITATGVDATATTPARKGGDVIVQVGSGDIAIGSIEARGGSAIAVEDDGAAGAKISLFTNDGGIAVGDIDVSGGAGREGLLDTGGLEPTAVGRGGNGGTIRISAGVAGVTGTRSGDIVVSGDLIARGGTSTASTILKSDGTLQTFSADGGSVTLSAPSENETRSIRLGAPGSPILVDTSGGHSTSDGGNAGSIDIVAGASGAGTGGGDVDLYARLIARGGDSTASGAGGNGGPVLVTSVAGSARVDAGDPALAAIATDGGAGIQGANPVVTGFDGGDAGVVAVTGGVDVEVRGISANGGTSDAGAAGSGAALELAAAGALTATQLDAPHVALAAGGDVSATLPARAAELFITSMEGAGTIDVSSADGLALAIAPSGAGSPSQTLSSFVSTGTDMRVEYELRSDTPDVSLGVERGAVALGQAGAVLAVRDSAGESTGAIVGVGTGSSAHIRSGGDVSLEAAEIGALTAGEPLVFEGAPGASLSLKARGDVFAALSSESATRFDFVDLLQRDVGASATLRSVDVLGAPSGSVIVTGDADAVRNQIDAIDTRNSGQAVAYRLDVDAAIPAGASDPVEAEIAVAAGAIQLGADLLVEGPGDIRLGDGAVANITANGHGVALRGGGRIADDRPAATSGFAIDMGDAGGDGPGLLLDADGGVGTQDAPLHVRAIGRVAGSAGNGGFYLANSGSGDIRISEVRDVLGELSAGIGDVGGDVALRNEAPGGRIVLASLGATQSHVVSAGDQLFGAPVEIGNARVDDLDGIVTPSNAARLAAGGDVVFTDRIDTSPDASVSLPTASGPVDVLVPGALLIETGGETQLPAQLGTTRALGSIETNGVRLTADTTVVLGAAPAGIENVTTSVDRSAFAGTARFAGPLDGGHALDIAAAGLDAAVGLDPSLSRVQFGGDVGARERLAGLEVDADRIDFSGAERVSTGSGGIRLNVPADDTITSGAPEIATISDAQGSLAFDTTGSFETGRLEKLAAVGSLSIHADQAARFGDLAASQIRVDAPLIVLKGREPSDVLQRDDTTLRDAGGDLVANDIAFSSFPEWDGAGNRTTFVLGSGGISAPGSLGDFEVIRFSSALDAVSAASFAGSDGTLLDLTGTGPPLVGNPSRELPRDVLRVTPGSPGRSDRAAPAARAQVSGEQVITYLHCAAEPRAAACPATEVAQPLSDPTLRGTALATERAVQIAADYRNLIASPDGRARLRASLMLALGAYRATAAGSGVDGAGFYAFLRRSPAHAQAREQLDALARLFAEVEMLGLTEADARGVQNALADEFARAAGEPGLSAAALIEAVRASGIGLPT